MARCSSCSVEVAEGPLCAGCAMAPSAIAVVPTMELPSSPAAPGGDLDRLVPGALLAGRYRIVAPIGHGAMGEVYRADDLRLGQTVALKLLPPARMQDERARARLAMEVRLARQVSHPNVCRVYDLGEAGGRLFITMEHVDGEDLDSLLRRIGRLPPDKAIEVAQQLCAALAATHDRGVLHRDLKPGNVMLDGRGQVRVTDYGIAVASAEATRGGVAGTPAFMAPELYAGGAATVRSDLYALGCLLFEMFTGKRAFDGRSVADLRLAHETTIPPHVTTFVRDADPAVERVILRCLEKDPAARPASARDVARALPGADPLEAAIAAGETPSPELVAAAGDAGAIPARRAWTLALLAVAGLALATALGGQVFLVLRMPPVRPIEYLAERARELLPARATGAKAVDRAHGFTYDWELLAHVEETGGWTAGREAELRRGELPILLYWYTESDEALLPVDPHGGIHADHPVRVGGFRQVVLDAGGRLRELIAFPPPRDDSRGPWAAPDWTPFFAAARLEPTNLAPADPVWTPLGACDRQWGWAGRGGREDDDELRVEAASYRGRPVEFHVAPSWRASRDRGTRAAGQGPPESAGLVLVNVLALAGAGFLAARNVWRGRADVRGAVRFAVTVAALLFGGWVVQGHHAPGGREYLVFATTLSFALFRGGTVLLFYLALEPFVRRRWPGLLVSWSRLLGGRLRDPAVGRDVLVGTLFGTAAVLADFLGHVVPRALALEAQAPELTALDPLLSARAFLGYLPRVVMSSLFSTTFALLFLVLLRAALRNQWLAAAALTGLMAAVMSSPGEPLLPAIVTFAIAAFVLVRFGFLAAVLLQVVFVLLNGLPISLDLGHPLAWCSLASMTFVLALVAFGLHSSVGRQALVPAGFLES